jgi:hypothetical protein
MATPRYGTATASGVVVANPAVKGNDEERSVETQSKVMVNGDILFNIVGGPIMIEELISVCQTANDATASTLQYKSNPNNTATATTFSGATATLASAAKGATVRLHPTALSTAPAIIAASAGGVSLGLNVSNRVIVHPGSISAVIGVGSTTGKWKHFLRYRPLSPAVQVTGA